MADTLSLSVLPREAAGKNLNSSRKSGLIPAVLYGRGISPKMFWVNIIEFGKVLHVTGESTIFSLVAGKSAALNVLVHDVQLDPISNRVSHVDFYQVDMDEELETDIPLEFIGEAPAVRELGGILVKTLESIGVRCLPKNLPHSIAVDISTLVTFDDQIKVSDLALGETIEIMTDVDTVLALVEAPRTDADMAALEVKAEMDVTKVAGVVKESAPAVEVDKKDKKK
ncbi:MAG: 50S ribosomal protein L25 [Candidatus Moranbacteria bacterium]|jgi:large subunit ribosomal protein L25|nr:50S ribosomal protein L25 [Candidatus Moranbacteria bacterium]MBP9801120.1 50S ribosomal protein L25 [Candidatus Moranbacteria bacterium]